MQVQSLGGRFPGEGPGNPLQYSCLENQTDRGPGRLQSTGSHKVRHDWSNLTTPPHTKSGFGLIGKSEVCESF